MVRPHLAALARDGQRPEQLFITCADSRVVPNLITASGPGDLFCVRNVGNVVPPHPSAATRHPLAADPPPDGPGDASVGAAVEYAVDILGVTTITVCGHSGCGGVRALMTGAAAPGSSLGDWLALSGMQVTDPADEQRCCIDNVVRQLANLRTYPVVQAAEAAGRLRLTGMYFDIAEARMYEVDPILGVHHPVHTRAA
jgi:carbonic anhydrase